MKVRQIGPANLSIPFHRLGWIDLASGLVLAFRVTIVTTADDGNVLPSLNGHFTLSQCNPLAPHDEDGKTHCNYAHCHTSVDLSFQYAGSQAGQRCPYGPVLV